YEQGRQAPFWIRQLAEAERAAGHQDRVIELHKEAVEARYDDFDSRRALIADALHRGDDEHLARHADVLHALATSAGELRYLARIYESQQREPEALEALRQAHEIAPQDAGVLVAQGRLLLRMEQEDAARDAFRQALALKPQDAETRELLEQLSPRERPDEKWAVPTKELLARRTEKDGYPSTVLQQLTVNTVYNNGLGSTFRQVAVQIHDDEGARQWRTYSMQFDPSSQRVQVRHARVHRGERVLEATRSFQRTLGQPWYRIYYDTRAHVVVFPSLEPGDVVEIRYRIDDVAHRNMFADYYGDLHFLQGLQPIVREDYVLITPEDRDFYFNEPELAGLEHETNTEGDRRVDHFHAEDVPAIVDEDGMPGMTEVAPYLHVSTYETWKQIGEWYWGLIKDQLYADESLEDTVDDLLDGASDLRTKVERIHNWVVDNTRYVALEFGIHGYKPYRVPQIVRRGFGDCKDKASLIYTMLEHAGIDAHIVLVRTRQNGRIEDLPASLAAFDHAIAYVPELELYLDATAEHSGTRELPVQDQGVTVLHVWPEGSKLTRTPVLPADRNHHERTMRVQLQPDGSADVQVDELVRGKQAARFRKNYEAEGTRSERFERSQRSTFPGLRLERVQFEQLLDLEEPIRFEWKAELPRMAQRNGDELTMPYTVVDDLLRGIARTSTRRHPLELGGTRSYAEERVVQLPPGMEATQVPEGREVKSDFGRVSLSVDEQGREVRMRTEVVIGTARVSPDEYPAFRRWVEKADALLRQRLTLQGGGR
ncbi:MAG: DUF3857 domain-containing protein, partial [Polyangiales bacterium]